MSKLSRADVAERLQKMTNPQLVAEFNTYAEAAGLPKTKRFGDKKSGRKRVLAAMAKAGVIPPSVDDNHQKRQILFRYPPNGVHNGAPAIPEEGTLRYRVQIALMAGETMEGIERIVEAFDVMRGVPSVNVKKRAYLVVRAQHFDYGWGLKEETSEGVKKIHIFSNVPPYRAKDRRGVLYAA